MKNHLLTLVFFFLSFNGFSQINFRENFEKLDPINNYPESTLEEKIKLHQTFLDKAIKEKNTLHLLYGNLYLFYDGLRGQDYVKASDYLNKATNICLKEKNNAWLGWVKHRKGILMVTLKEFENAIPPYEEAANLCGMAGDSLCLGESLEQIGAMYAKLEKYDLAEAYFSRAFPIIRKFGNQKQLSVTLNNYGILQAHQDKPQKAIPYYQEAIVIYKELGKLKEQAMATNNLADAYFRMNNYDSAERLFLNCINMNNRNLIYENLISNYYGLAALYESKGEHKKAKDFYIKYYELRDSLIGEQKQIRIAELEADNALKEKEVELSVSKLKLEKSNAKTHRLIAYIIGILLLTGYFLLQWWFKLQSARKTIAANMDGLERLKKILINKNHQLVALENKINQLENQEQPSNDKKEDTVVEFERYNHRILTNDDWFEFKRHFEKVYPNYITKLRSKYPNLTEAEERLCLFMKANMNQKEIAMILGISAESVKKTRQRLRKKFDIESSEELLKILNSI